MDFQTAIKTCLSKYATFQGRAHRPEYWWFVLFGFLVQLASSAIDAGLLGFEMGGGPVSGLVGLGLFLPSLAAAVRRLHDTDRSGWWMLLILLPVIGTLVLLWWLTRPGDTTMNRFGAPD
jgi:uncharacterized membrane protein YhaH (DUF805 family)